MRAGYLCSQEGADIGWIGETWQETTVSEQEGAKRESGKR